MGALMSESDEVGSSGGVDECVSTEQFPAWFYAEIVIGNEYRVVSIFHVHTPAGLVPYWYEDHENPHRGLPLTKALRPVLLGDYGSYLAEADNMAWFVALCRVLDDLPDPLQTVQVIRWLVRRGIAYGHNARTDAANALAEVTASMKRRQSDFEKIWSLITGYARPPT